jgi:hypothetical protein
VLTSLYACFVCSCLCCTVLCCAVQGVDVVAAHGDKDQQERLDAVRDFKTGVSCWHRRKRQGSIEACSSARTYSCLWSLAGWVGSLTVRTVSAFLPYLHPVQASRTCWLPRMLPARAWTSLVCST